jgi:hypothetical protein
MEVLNSKTAPLYEAKKLSKIRLVPLAGRIRFSDISSLEEVGQHPISAETHRISDAVSHSFGSCSQKKPPHRLAPGVAVEKLVSKPTQSFSMYTG